MVDVDALFELKWKKEGDSSIRAINRAKKIKKKACTFALLKDCHSFHKCDIYAFKIARQE